MELRFEYTPYIWVTLATLVFPVALVFHALRNRSVPGAVPFLVVLVTVIPWIVGNGLELLSADDETRIFWFRFQAVLFLPVVTAVLCFVIEYSGMGIWLARPVLAVLAVPVLAYFILVTTNNYHYLVWKEISVDGFVRVAHGPANWAVIGYGGLLSLLHIAVLVRLFVRSPRHRWIAGWLIIAPFITRAGYFLSITDWNPFAPVNPTVIAVNVAVVPYAFAVFRFHMFDVVSVARDTIFEKMRDGMIVLDAGNRIVDLNETVQELIGVVRSKVLGRRAEDVLHDYPDLLGIVGNSAGMKGEVFFDGSCARWFQVSASPIADGRRRIQLGRIVWLHDITDERLARTQMLDQQKTLAKLEERELLARELHDGVGQMLAAAHLQAESAIELLARGDGGMAETCLRRLTDVTREAKGSIRGYLHGVKAAPRGQGLVPPLRGALDDFSRDYGIRTEFVVPSDLRNAQIGAAVETQVLPIIREALTNVRRHAGAGLVQVTVASSDGYIQVTVEDDGRGFEPEEVVEKQGFGLRSMRGRAESVEGYLEVDSAPGEGTRVTVRLPMRKEGP